MYNLAGELTDTDHYLFIAEVRERFVISQQAGQKYSQEAK